MELDCRDPEQRMARLSPWKRGRSESWGPYRTSRYSFAEKFDTNTDSNIDLDLDIKKLALKVSPFVVSLVSLTGEKPLFMGSGTITESEEVNGTYFGTILTSASLLRTSAESDAIPDDIKVNVHLRDGTLCEGQVLAYDWHYNIAWIKIKSDAPLATASLRLLDDTMCVDPSGMQDKELGSNSFLFHPHSDFFKLCPGDLVVAVGRYFQPPNEIMTAPGRFSIDRCDFDCKELFRGNCKISKCGIGGPLINRHGEVIGVNFYDELCTPFLPINIVSKCLEHFNKYGRFSRPLLGMEMTNLYAASLRNLDRINLKFPNDSNGVFVEKVIEGSLAECAGILSGDVIVQCAGNFVRSVLEFYEISLDKCGESVDVVVLRSRTGDRLNLILKVGETSSDKINSWPLPTRCMVHVKRVR
ncbi:putative protease Do-like 14 [Rhododendron vialii]|uniref:putative protease Do-like 14 n=1 Tax=Rhododendron vialii TaxID=182163 RepID=UPI00266019D9|nr:putative protease Do-like 14 [Rhododendron vialii]XP_058198766.1 putative protease Do-like 14 [Rhododendron vialii]